MIKHFSRYLSVALFVFTFTGICSAQDDADKKYNVLFIISDDLTATALSCYGNEGLSHAQHRFDRFARDTIHTGVLPGNLLRPVAGFVHERAITRMRRAYWVTRTRVRRLAIERPGRSTSKTMATTQPGSARSITWESLAGSKMAATEPTTRLSWTERFNSPGPEWKAPGDGETLEGNPDGQTPRCRWQHLRRCRS